MNEPLSEHPQPDAVAPSAPPSLWLYVAMSLLAATLAGLAVFLLGRSDWPSLLLNISAGLVSALVVLVVVERRIRQSELTSLRQAPLRAQLSLSAIIFPSTRAARSYARGHLAALEPLLVQRVPTPALDRLEPKLLSGCSLLAGPGMGKTTWLQSIAAKYARRFLVSNGTEKSVVLYPLRLWRAGISLEEAVLDHVQSFAACGRITARKFIRTRVSTLLLDGYDEIFMQDHSFSTDMQALKAAYPEVAISVASRPNYPNPLPDAEVVLVPEPSAEEVANIRRKWGLRASDA